MSGEKRCAKPGPDADRACHKATGHAGDHEALTERGEIHWETPGPSEVAETTAGEREELALAGHGLRCMETPCAACLIEMVLDDHRAMVSGDDDGWHVICSCGHDELGVGVNAHLATQLAARVSAAETKARADERERIAQAIEGAIEAHRNAGSSRPVLSSLAPLPGLVRGDAR